MMNICDPQRRSKLVEEEAAALQHLAHIRTEINACVPAGRLPPEIISGIFMQVRGLAKHPWEMNQSMVCMSHVCRRWRDVALGNPTLWSFIALRKHVLTTAFLERSRNARLTLLYQWPDGLRTPMVDPDTSFTIIQPYTNRFTHVDVSLGKENVNQFTKLFQQSVWHDLRSLKLKHPADAFDVDLFPLQVPPHLHTLDLSEVMPLTWDIPELFRNLRTLKLTASHAAAMKITLPVFLDVLDACVVLESFSLTILSDHSSMSPDNYRPAHPLRLVRLNSLSYLCLDICRYQDVEHLMLHLVIPESTHVHLSFGDSFAKVNPLHCFNSTSHSHLRFLEAMTSIRISRNKYFSILMSASHDGHTDQPCFTSQVGRREVYMDPWVLGSLLEVGTVFPHSRLTKLELYFSSQHLRNITRKNWIAVLPHLPHLTTLRLARAPPSTTDYPHSKEESEDIDPDFGILDDSEYYIPLLTALVVPQSITHRPTLVPFLRRLDFEDPVPLSDGLKLAMYQCVVSRRAMLADPAQFQLTVGGSASRE